MLGAAIAAGVTASFGTPIAGVIFSIECTSTYYLVGNLWKSFFCVTLSMLVYKAIYTLGMYIKH